jgi:hypothetical protein
MCALEHEVVGMCLRETPAIAHCLLVAGTLAGVNDSPYIVAPAAISFSPYEESVMDFDHRPFLDTHV